MVGQQHAKLYAITFFLFHLSEDKTRKHKERTLGTGPGEQEGSGGEERGWEGEEETGEEGGRKGGGGGKGEGRGAGEGRKHAGEHAIWSEVFAQEQNPVYRNSLRSKRADT